MAFRKSKVVIILSIIILVAMLIGSCDLLDNLKSNSTSDNDSLEEQIIGKWTYKTETSKKSVYLISSFEFRKDGSVSFSVDTTEAEGVITDINYEISGTTLTLIYLDGTTTEVYEDVSVFGNVLYIMGDDKPFIKENISALKSTESTKNPDIIPKSTTGSTPAETTGILESITESTTQPTTINPLVLKKGDKGDDVKDLQAKLRDIGLYTGAFDGSFGSITEASVKKLQENYNLPQDGIVKDETWIALDNALKPTEEIPITETNNNNTSEDTIYFRQYNEAINSLGNLSSTSSGVLKPNISSYFKIPVKIEENIRKYEWKNDIGDIELSIQEPSDYRSSKDGKNNFDMYCIIDSERFSNNKEFFEYCVYPITAVILSVDSKTKTVEDALDVYNALKDNYGGNINGVSYRLVDLNGDGIFDMFVASVGISKNEPTTEKNITDNKNISSNTFKLYDPKEYGVVDYGALFGVKEKVLSTDSLKYYGYFDVSKDSLILYNTALILNGFTGGFDDEFFEYSSINDILYNDNIVSYKKEYGDKEIKVFLQRTLSSDFMIMFSLGEPYVDPKTQIEFSDFELYLDNIGEYGFQNYGLTFNIKNNSDSELIISGLTIRTYSERDGKKYHTTGSVSLNDITLKVGNNEIKIPDKTKEQWQWRYVMGFDKSANINLEEYKVELNDYYSVKKK